MSLYVESFGERSSPNLVLLHGWAMHSGVWGSVRDGLAQKFHLHLVDLPGHGLSHVCAREAANSQEHPSVPVLDAIAEVLPSTFTLCGWSLGGQLAIELALREPMRVRKLALISTAPCFVKRQDWQWGMEASMLQLFAAEFKARLCDHHEAVSYVAGEWRRGCNKDVISACGSLVERREPDKAALEAGLKILLASDLRNELKHIHQPVLMVHGAQDVITHPNAAKWMNEQFLRSELEMLPQCGHAPFLSYPEQFVSNLARFAGE